MTDTLSRVVVPYADFLQHRERRRATTAEAERQNDRRTIDTQAVVSAIPLANGEAEATPAVSVEKEDRPGKQAPVQNAERIT
jgi:hypothetical protein